MVDWNLEFEIWNFEFGIWNLEFEIWNLEFGIWNLELKKIPIIKRFRKVENCIQLEHEFLVIRPNVILKNLKMYKRMYCIFILTVAFFVYFQGNRLDLDHKLMFHYLRNSLAFLIFPMVVIFIISITCAHIISSYHDQFAIKLVLYVSTGIYT